MQSLEAQRYGTGLGDKNLRGRIKLFEAIEFAAWGGCGRRGWLSKCARVRGWALLSRTRWGDDWGDWKMPDQQCLELQA